MSTKPDKSMSRHEYRIADGGVVETELRSDGAGFPHTVELSVFFGGARIGVLMSAPEAAAVAKRLNALVRDARAANKADMAARKSRRTPVASGR